MKVFFSIAMMCLAVANIVSAQQKSISDPVAYNDYIVERQVEIGDAIGVILQMLEGDYTLDEMLAQVDVAVTTVRKTIVTLESLETMEPDFGMRAEALALFGFYERTINVTYRDMIREIYKEEPDIFWMDEVQTKLSLEEAGYDERFLKAQTDFATHYGFVLSGADGE